MKFNVKPTPGFIKYFKNTAWLFFEKILRLFVGLIVGVWVARYLGPENFGMISFVIAFFGLFTPLCRLGLNGIISREIAKNECNTSQLLTNAIFLRLIGSFSVFFIYYFYITFKKENEIYFYLGIIFSTIMLFRSFEVIELYFKAKVRAYLVVIANIIAILFSCTLKVYLINYEYSLIYFAYANLVEVFIFILLLCVFFYRETISFKLNSLSRNKSLKLLKESWPYVLSGIGSVMFLKIDQIMIEEILGNVELGVYSAAIKISTFIYFIPITICLSIQTAIVNAKQLSENLYINRLHNLFLTMAILGYILIIPISYFSSRIINFLYGSDYYLSGEVLAIHIFAAIFVFIGSPRSLWIVNESQQKFLLFSNFGAGLLNIVLNLIWIPKYGVTGAAWATLFSFAFTYLFSGIFYKPIQRVMHMQLISLTLIGLFPKFNPNKN